MSAHAVNTIAFTFITPSYVFFNIDISERQRQHLKYLALMISISEIFRASLTTTCAEQMN